jgi:hypothetical protein
MIHVIPEYDIKPHDCSSTCECGCSYDPEYEAVIHEAFEDFGQRWMGCEEFNFVKDKP